MPTTKSTNREIILRHNEQRTFFTDQHLAQQAMQPSMYYVAARVFE